MPIAIDEVNATVAEEPGQQARQPSSSGGPSQKAIAETLRRELRKMKARELRLKAD